MGLSGEQLQAATEVVGYAPTIRDAATILRGRYPGVRAIVVDEMDMRDETPAVRVLAVPQRLASIVLDVDVVLAHNLLLRGTRSSVPTVNNRIRRRFIP